jgi:serpin B
MRAEHVRFAEKDGAAAVELPYAGRRFSMVVVLPAAGGPATLPEGLLGALDGKSVAVHLPRFKIESAFQLAETLQAMGMKSAFDLTADFSGMNGKKDLFISAVAHKAFVAVDEEGTEAAAATSVQIRVKGEAKKPVVFRADRPFLFLIRDGETGSILFLGRVSDPR